MTARMYRPGTDVIDITAPGGIAALLEFHRATFGDARMDATGDGEGDDGADDGPKLNEHGFPDQTPVKDMATEHQVAYWKHQARKHEERASRAADYDAVKAERDALKAKAQSPDERAAAEKLANERSAGKAEATAELAPKLVAAEIKAAAAGRITAETLAALTAGIDATKFLTPSGEVDADKVQQLVDGLAPKDDKKWPDTGQGRRQQQKATGLSAGRDLYAARHPEKKS